MDGDAVGQCFGKIDMPGGDDPTDLVRNRLIVDGIGHRVAARIDLARQPNIDAHRLRLALFVAVHADACASSSRSRISTRTRRLVIR